VGQLENTAAVKAVTASSTTTTAAAITSAGTDALKVATAVSGIAPPAATGVVATDATNQAAFLQGLRSIVPAGYELTPEMLAKMPPWWTIYVEVVVAGIIAGFTINALFAFGEEYGWRGVLQDLLAPQKHAVLVEADIKK